MGPKLIWCRVRNLTPLQIRELISKMFYVFDKRLTSLLTKFKLIFCLLVAKGQLISKGIFKVFNCTKNENIFVFLPYPGQIKKVA